jgi:hypothetical protein
MTSPEVRRRAARALRDAGRRHLQPIGATGNKGGRLWTVDRRWWLVNIEFQPSSYSVGAYLNVGVQHLWHPLDYRIFQYSSRQPIDGHKAFVELDGDEAEVTEHADAVARAARAAADRWLREFAADLAHLEWLAQRTDDPWDAFNAAFALMAIGRPAAASETFAAIPADLDVSIEWHAELAAECRELAQLAATPDRFAAEADRRIDETRVLLRLPPRNEASGPGSADARPRAKLS